MEMGGDVPSAESLVGWLLENQQLRLTSLSDSDSLTGSDQSSCESDTSSDEYEEAEGAFGYVQVRFFFFNLVICLHNSVQLNFTHVGSVKNTI